MRTKLRSKITLLFMAFALMLAMPAVALADVLDSDADTVMSGVSGGTKSYKVGDPEAEVKYWIAEGNQSGINGCDVSSTNPATITLNLPQGVTASTTTLKFEKCGTSTSNTQTVKFKANTQGNYSITASVPAKTETQHITNQANFTLVVSADPTVTDVAPADGATGVAVGTNVEATFSEAMTATTINSSTFTLTKQGASQPVPAVVTYDSTTKKATLNPNNDLDSSSDYTATVVGGTSGAKDLAGNGLDQDPNTSGVQNKTWSFRTAAPPCTPVSVTTQPSGQSITYGADATFTADSSGNPAPSVQWQKSTDNGTNWNNVAGATSKTLLLTKPSVSQSGNQYRAVFTNECSGTKTATSNAAALTVAQKSVTGSFTAANKEYDGNTNATITARDLNGAISGDNVSLTGGTASFNTKNVGDDKPVSGSGFALGGTDAGNYTLGSVSNTTASITPKALSGSFTAADKEYDGNDVAQITGSNLTGKINDDVVSLGGSAKFNNKNVGENKPVTLTNGALSGTDAGNYTISGVSDATASITAKSITGSFTAANKEYDGNTNATITARDLNGAISGDNVSLTGGSASFDNANVGTGKTVTATGFTLNGVDASNYSLAAGPWTAQANITPLGITGTFTAADKVWDGNTNAQITGRDLNGKLNGDDVSLTGGTASFDNAHVGQNKPVTGSGFSLAGADKGNYTLGSVANTTASITAWTPEGFYSPIGISNSFYKTKGEAVPAATSTTVWQSAKGGSTIPLKFNVSAGIEKKTNTDAVKGFGAVKLSTCSGSTLDPVEELATAGSTSLRYDATEGQFIQNWKTGTVSSDTCYRVTVTFQDDTAIHTFVRLRK